MEYFLNQPQLVITFSDVSYDTTSANYATECSKADVVWTLVVNNADTFTFPSATLATRTATVLSSDTADLGTYVIVMTATIEAPYAATGSITSLVQTVTLTVKECKDSTAQIVLVADSAPTPVTSVTYVTDGSQIDHFLNDAQKVLTFPELLFDLSSTD